MSPVWQEGELQPHLRYLASDDAEFEVKAADILGLAAAAVIREVVQQECTFKGIGFPRPGCFSDELVAKWGNIRGHQLATPTVESLGMRCQNSFGWLARARVRAVVAPYPSAAGDQVLGRHPRLPQRAERNHVEADNLYPRLMVVQTRRALRK